MRKSTGCAANTTRSTLSPNRCARTAPRRASLRDAARIELGLRAFLEAGGFNAFTDTFEDLHGLKQLPGVAAQRLMADGYGFGAEGDWKTAALVRAMKVMSVGMKGGTSFMEDYTYHLDPANAAGARCAHAGDLPVDRGGPAIAGDSSALDRRQGRPGAVGVRRAARPGHQRRDSRSGRPFSHAGQRGRRCRSARAAAEACPSPAPCGGCAPDFQTAAAAWILAGGPHHTGFSQAVTTEQLEAFAEMAGVELVVIDADTCVRTFKKILRLNEAYYN